MIDVSTIIVAELNKIGLKVHNEYFVDSKTEIPCITYRLQDNSTYVDGNTIGYSRQVYHVKVWGNSLQVLADYGVQIDTIMRNLGFTRTALIDLWLDGIGQRDMRFEALSLENY